VTPEALKSLADEAQKRCAGGEDTDKIQTDVWQKAAQTTATPNTNFGVLSRGQLNQQQLSQGLVQAITSLKSGESSQVIDDNGFYYIFKVDGKRLVQLKDATNEIAKALQDKNFQDKMNKALAGYKAEKLNEDFFGPTPQVATAPAPAGTKK
jgi:parvulin-like peptidyl-prolyl isomerase